MENLIEIEIIKPLRSKTKMQSSEITKLIQSIFQWSISNLPKKGLKLDENDSNHKKVYWNHPNVCAVYDIINFYSHRNHSRNLLESGTHCNTFYTHTGRDWRLDKEIILKISQNFMFCFLVEINILKIHK